MPSPLITDRATLDTTLQAQFGSRTGLGKWVRSSLKDLQIGTLTVGALLTATNASGTLSYTILADTMIVSLDTVGGLTLSAATSELTIRLPDNWRFAPRTGDFIPRRALAPVLTYDGAAVQSVGYLYVDERFPELLFVHRAVGGGNFTAGTVYVFGQLAFECQHLGERS